MAMRTLLTVCVLTVSALSAAQPHPAARDAVLAAGQMWKDAVLKHDRTMLQILLSDELVYVHSSGLIQTKTDFIESVMTDSTKYISIDFGDVKVRQYGDTVIVNRFADFKTEQTGSSHVYLTEVWVPRDGGWELVSRHASKPAPAK